MWIAHLGQASSLQGHFGVNWGVLAGNDWGIGSGWQQSKQNSTLLAVTRQWARMQCRNLWRVEVPLLHPYFAYSYHVASCKKLMLSCNGAFCLILLAAVLLMVLWWLHQGTNDNDASLQSWSFNMLTWHGKLLWRVSEGKAHAGRWSRVPRLPSWRVETSVFTEFLQFRIPFGDHPLKLERYRED